VPNVLKNADAGSVAHVADAASIGVTSKGYVRRWKAAPISSISNPASGIPPG
jgi:hypothetical protein